MVANIPLATASHTDKAQGQGRWAVESYIAINMDTGEGVVLISLI